MDFTPYYRKGKKPGMIKKEMRDKSGKKKVVRLRKNKPRRCSAVRRICIVCTKTAIHPLDSNYSKKICKDCDD